MYKHFRAGILSLKFAWHQNNEAPVLTRVSGNNRSRNIYCCYCCYIIGKKKIAFCSCILDTLKIKGKLFHSPRSLLSPQWNQLHPGVTKEGATANFSDMSCTKGHKIIRRKLREEIIIIKLLQSDFSNNICKSLRKSSVEESYYCAKAQYFLLLKHLPICQIAIYISMEIPPVNIF